MRFLEPKRALVAPLVCAVALTFLPSASAAFKHLREGMTVPEVKGTDLLTGATVTSAPSGKEGEVTIVAFWATWSQRSLDLLAGLDTMQADLEGHPLRILTINVEGEEISGDRRALVEQTVADLGLTFPVLIDEGLERFYEFGVIAVPSLALIDSEGILRFGPAGYSYLVRDQIRDAVESLLGLTVASEVVADTIYRPTAEAGRRHNLAIRLTNQRKYERALTQVDRAIEADPRFAASMALRGDILLALEELEQAEAAFAQAVEIDEASTVAWAGWGRALLRSGDVAGAIDKLDSALELEATYRPALLDLARCHAESQEYERSLELVREAIELNPRDFVAHSIEGRLHRARGDLRSALVSLERALELAFPAP